MRWISQVAHVLAKDLRELWRFVAVYLVVVAVCTMNALRWMPWDNAPAFMSLILLLMVGMFLLASAVQADSPTGADAFWASRPLYPSAVLAAKGCLALLTVAAPLAGAAAALASYRLEARDVAAYAAGSAALYAAVLGAAMLLAGLSRDLRTFVIMAVAVPLVVLLIGAMFDFSTPGGIRGAMAVLSGAGALALLVYVYHRRDGSRWTRVAGFAAVAIFFYSGIVPSSSRRSSQRASARRGVAGTPYTGPRPELRLVVFTGPPSRAAVTPAIRPQSGECSGLEKTKGPLVLNVLTLPKGRMPVLVDAEVVYQLCDGTALRAPLERFVSLASMARPALRAGMRWLEPGPHADGLRQQLDVSLTREQRRALSNGFARVVLEGRMVMFESRMSGTMDLRQGATLVDVGRRAELDKVTWDDGDLAVDLRTLTVPRRGEPESPDDLLRFNNATEYVLESPERHEAFPIQRQQMNESPFWLVLPGAPLQHRRVHLELPPLRDTRIPLGDAWRRGRLMLFDWVERGSYPVRLELTGEAMESMSTPTGHRRPLARSPGRGSPGR